VPYHQGIDRAAGDPGFFSFLGKGLSAIGGLLPGPIGAVAGLAGRAISGGGAAPQPPTVPFQRTGGIRAQFPGGSIGIPGGPQITLTGGGFAAGGTALARTGPAGPGPMVPPRGHHLNRSSYFLRDGTFVPEGTRFVRNRTRNPANPRALRRAISRAKSFDRLVKRNRKALRALSRI